MKKNTADRLTSQSITLTLPRLHEAQQRIKHDARRFNVIRCGRRFGKDVLGNDTLLHPALQGAPVAWFAPTYKMLGDNWRQARNTLQPITARISEQDKRIELITSGVIDMWSLDNHDAARGRKYKLIVVNEAAMVKNLQEAWEMVLRPTLADYEGSAYFTSTPRGLNYFYNLDQQAGDDWAHFHFTTYDNPFIKRSEIDALKAMLPERTFRQEILAEYVEDGAYFQGVDQCAVIDAPDQPGQHADHHCVMGVDWAKSEDFTVLTVGCRECARVVDWKHFNRIDYHFQRSMLIDLAQRWKVGNIVAEANSIGEPNIEELQRAGLPVIGFQTTAVSKPLIIEALALALARNEIKVPREYGDELRTYEVEIGSAGRPKFSAPEGLHDDRVISLALMLNAMTTGVRVIQNPFYD